MDHSKYVMRLFLLGWMSFSCVLPALCEEQAQPDDVQSRRTKFKEMFEKLLPAHIYGKVLDKNNTPISGAEVKLNWQNANVLIGKPDPGQTTWITTGADGSWTFTIDKPWRAFVIDVRKPGYQYNAQENQSRDLIHDKTSRQNPVVIHLRQKGETVFLLRSKGQIIRLFSPAMKSASLDLMQETAQAHPKAGEYSDLQVEVIYGASNRKWTVTYKATNEMDGLMLSENLLYEAPQDGYLKKVVVDGPPWPKYLYLRSRNPSVYSRLDLEHSSWKESKTKDGVRINYRGWINPYGSRNLEYDEELDKEWKLRKKLEKEAKSVLKQGKRPKKPDLKALIKAEKEKKK